MLLVAFNTSGGPTLGFALGWAPEKQVALIFGVGCAFCMCQVPRRLALTAGVPQRGIGRQQLYSTRLGRARNR